MAEKKKPLKRHAALIPFSREHHHSLLLGWKIRKGLDKGVSVERIKKYTDWFFENHIEPHFEEEEKYVFPVLGDEHPQIKKVLAEHRRLKQLFNKKKDIEKSLYHIEEELDRHIRFEERELFQLIQKEATSSELQKIKDIHTEHDFIDNTSDEFWN